MWQVCCPSSHVQARQTSEWSRHVCEQFLAAGTFPNVVVVSSSLPTWSQFSLKAGEGGAPYMSHKSIHRTGLVSDLNVLPTRRISNGDTRWKETIGTQNLSALILAFQGCSPLKKRTCSSSRYIPAFMSVVARSLSPNFSSSDSRCASETISGCRIKSSSMVAFDKIADDPP